MGKSSVPDGPDWDALIAQAERFNQMNYQLQREYMDFMKWAYADQKEISDKVADIQLPGMEDQAGLAQDLRDKYREMGLPYEEEYIKELQDWDTAERRDERAGEAQAAVGLAQDAARESELRRLESYGIDPSQTRSAALDSRLRLAEAVQKAAAGNEQRRLVEQEGLQYGATAVDLARAWPGIAGQSASGAIAAGNAALSGSQSTDQFMASAFPTSSNILSQGMSGLTGAYNAAGNIYGNELAAYQLQQQYGPASGIGNLLGTALGAAGAAGGFGPLFGFAEGGPTDKGTQPMAVPRPPSTGIPQDNVPAMLNKDEFVIPDDVAKWEGEKNLNKLINKAREDKARTDMERRQNQMALGIPA